ncbi:AraC family transcriptional regulator [Metasolibacillus meyeri]|uniref:AraC family transcriptional regulator n=1 Tax=Metasolibacillus meyeri TaxID=1071052 RepID=UPI000D3014C0|nr:AraC family transcriptional regulator [Metasolibacillus meyeri]
MNYEAYTLLWENTYAKVKKMEYKHHTTTAIKQTMKHSAFLIITEGEVDLLIGQQPYRVQQFSIFHVGKSELLQVKTAKSFSYYMIYYKGDVLYVDAFIQHLHIEYRPFHTSFSCVPANPIAIELLLQDMYIKWKTGSFQEHLFVKALFYELIYRIFQELTEGNGKPHEIDLAETARLYLEQHVHEAITMQKLADSLKISTRHLLRIFKERYGEGPQNYLQQLRIELAKHYLQSNQLSIKEVATALGYEDEYYFSRAFKKQVQIAPSTYRLKYASETSDFPITNDNHFHYNKNQLAQAIRFEGREHKLMKQTFINSIRLPFLASLILLLGACGYEDEQEKIEKVATHIVTDGVGREVEIPVEPQRIVTDQYLEILVALDTPPVGAGEHVLRTDYMKDYIDGIESIGLPVNMESVLQLKPDLIITTAEPGKEAEKLEGLEKIAPTVVVPWLNGEDMYAQMRAVAKLIGKEQQADEWIVSLEKKGQEAQEQIKGIIGEEETVTIMMTYGKEQPRIYGGRNIGHVFYRLLGLNPTPFIQEKIKEDPNFGSFNNEDISLEVLPQYVGNWLIVLDYKTDDGDDGKTMSDIKESALWKNLEAVKNNHVIYLPQDPFFSYSPIAIEQSLESAISLIKERAR